MNIEDVLREMRETVNSSDGIAIAEKLIRWEHWTNVEVERLRTTLQEWKAEARAHAAEIERLTRKVDHLSKNKCMGCIDAICDDCAGEEVKT